MLRVKLNVRIVDAVEICDESLLYKCISPMPFRRWSPRRSYLERAIPAGLRKKVLLVDGEAVGQVEYAPAGFSGYPIYGEKLVVMNCIWVLRRAKGHRFGKLLVRHMVESEQWASSFATVGLEGHWSPWMKKMHMEYLGFKSIDSFKVEALYKRVGWKFKLHLMWLPRHSGAPKPRWDKEEMLRGVYFCIAHPLYHPMKIRDAYIFRTVSNR